MDCIFCKIAKKDISSMLVYEDDLITAFMDINPQCDGHTLLIPKKHYEDYTTVPTEILMHIFKKAEELGVILTSKLKTKGYRLIINYGDEQEIKHFHLHILPNVSKKASKNINELYTEITKKS